MRPRPVQTRLLWCAVATVVAAVAGRWSGAEGAPLRGTGVSTAADSAETSSPAECVFEPASGGPRAIVVRDEGARRILEFRLKGEAQGLAAQLLANQQSAVWCTDRDPSSSPSSAGARPAALGIMEPWEQGDKATGGGVVGIGSGVADSPPHSNSCRLPPCLVDVHQLLWPYAVQIRGIVGELISSRGAEKGVQGAMLGGGAGSLAMSLEAAFPALKHLDVAELDKEVTLVARDFFGFASSADERLTIYEAEGRQFLAGAKHYYHFVIVDAFANKIDGEGAVPVNLVTCQFLSEVKTALVRGSGVVMMNLLTQDQQFTNSVLATYVHAFGAQCVYTRAVSDYQMIVIGFGLDEAICRDPTDAAAAIAALAGRVSEAFAPVDRSRKVGASPIADPGESCK